MKEKYDVVVCGGGIAGTAAALAAARQGRKVLLVEKQSMTGGLATAGLIYIYLPVSDDGGRVIAGGITAELLRRCPEYGPFDFPPQWGGPAGGDPGCDARRCECCFSPAGFALTLEKMLREAEVDLRLETSLINAVCDSSGRVVSVELFCGAEHSTVSADCFVDASGGAYLLRLAGAQVFGELNYHNPWAMEMAPGAVGNYYLTGGLQVKVMLPPEEFEPMKQVLSADEINEFLRRQYIAIRRRYDQLPSDQRKKIYPVHLPAMPQLRKIARIKGKTPILSGEAGAVKADSVGVAADWRSVSQPAWETPYGALLPETVRGILAAGRCIDASGDAWEVFRVIPAAAMTGEAAGTAAAMAAERGIDPADLPVADLQKELQRHGVILHIADGQENHGNFTGEKDVSASAAGE